MANIKKILVPTDFSENSLSVFKFVKTTAKNYGAKVDLIYILQEASPLFEFTRDPLGNVFSEKKQYTKIRENLITKLEKIMNDEVEEAYRGKVMVFNENSPSSAIAKHAEKEGYDLIMIASRGWGNSIFKRGSVTEKLIRHSSTPVLSVNKGYDPDIRKILVPTDGSRASFAALPLALTVAEKNKASIDLLNIYVYESFTARTIGGDPGRYTLQEMQEFVMKNLKEFVSNNPHRLQFVEEPTSSTDAFKLKNKEGHTTTITIQAQKAFSAQEAIIGYANDNAQLVIIATRGRNAVSNLFVGSTTEKVARHLKMPVITQRPTKKQMKE